MKAIKLSMLFFICVTKVGAVDAAILFSDDFENTNYSKNNWYQNIGNRIHDSRAAESGHSAAISQNRYLYRAQHLPAGTDQIRVSFWLRIGNNRFSQKPQGNSKLYLSIYGKNGRWQTRTISRGPSRAGDVINYSVVFLASELYPDGYIDVYLDAVRRGTYHIDNFIIATESNGLHHFQIEPASTSASVCSPLEISVSAKDSAGQILTDYQGSLELSTSGGHGHWTSLNAGAGFSAGINNSGRASYQFSSSDNGVARFQLSNAQAQSINISAVDTSAGVSNSSSAISFAKNGFLVSHSDSLADDVVAGRAHRLKLTMVKQQGDGQSCGVAEDYQANSLKVQLNRHSQDPGGAAPQLLYFDGSQRLAAVLSTNRQSLALKFVNGEANVQLLSSDVGSYSLSLYDDSHSFSDAEISGSSGNMVVRPFALYFQADGNPQATTAAGPIYRKAGQTFSASVRAVAWQAEDDLNNDGLADGRQDADPSNNAELSDNPSLASFDEPVLMQASLLAPANGSDSNLFIEGQSSALLSNFSGGIAATGQLIYDNVGIIQVHSRIADGSFLGSAYSQRIATVSPVLGRFIPYDLQLQELNLSMACGSGNFSFMGQPFELSGKIIARNKAGAVATNYSQDFIKLDQGIGTISLGARVGRQIFNFRLAQQQLSLQWQQGRADYRASVAFNRNASPDGPYESLQLGIKLADADGVKLPVADLDMAFIYGDIISRDHQSIGQANFYFGRLQLNGAYGPETADLPVKFISEYWRNGFHKMIPDSCTKIPRANIVSVGKGSLQSDSHLQRSIGAATTQFNYGRLNSATVDLLGGDADHFFSAPGLGNTGSFTVQLSTEGLPWLRYDWNQDGSHNDVQLPEVEYEFGRYRGHDRIIYWREVLR